MTKTLKTYKFRAECVHDVNELLKALPFKYRIMIESRSPFPDVVVELTCDIGLADILQAMATIPDSHVMCETLDFASLYTGIRRY
jgi:hypothetical protein